jgi:hypothetical protein
MGCQQLFLFRVVDLGQGFLRTCYFHHGAVLGAVAGSKTRNSLLDRFQVDASLYRPIRHGPSFRRHD